MLRLSFPYSHAFKGGQLTLADDGDPHGECIVEYGDGITVIGQVVDHDVAFYDVAVPEYMTAKGSIVVAHTWRIMQRDGESVWRSMPLADSNDRPQNL